MSQGVTGETFVSLQFTVEDRSYPFVSASADGGRTVMEQFLPRGEGTYAEFFSTHGTDPGRFVTHADDDADVRVLADRDDGGLVECVVGDRCPAVSLAELGTVPRRVEGRDGVGYLRTDVPPTADATSVSEQFLAAHPTADLRAKAQREVATPPFTRRAVETTLRSRLTDRQRDVVRAAVEAGYYEWPRETSGEELADRLDIAGATLHEHLRAAENALMATLFGGVPPGRDPPSGGQY